MTVKRYDADRLMDLNGESSTGEWVRYEDYQALEKKLAEAMERVGVLSDWDEDDGYAYEPPNCWTCDDTGVEYVVVGTRPRKEGDFGDFSLDGGDMGRGNGALYDINEDGTVTRSWGMKNIYKPRPCSKGCLAT